MQKSDLDEMLTFVPTAAFVLNHTGTFVFLNAAAASLTGYSERELLNKSLTLLFPSLPDRQKFYHSIKPEYVNFNLLADFEKKDGGILRIKLTAKWRDAEKVLAVFLTDLTEEKNLAEKFAKIFYKSPAAKVLSEADSGIIVDVNETFCKLTKHVREELIGMNAAELDFFKDFKDQEVLINLLKEHGRVHNYELQTRSKTNQELFLLLSVETIELNKKNFLLSTCLDITEKKKIEQRLFRQTQIMNELSDAGTRLWRAKDLIEGCNEMLLYATQLFDNCKSDIQLYNRQHNMLTTAASLGFSDEFNNHFSEVQESTDSFCWRALKQRKQLNTVDPPATEQSYLQQNFPNPVKTTTSVSFRLPLNVHQAHLLITDIAGKQVQILSLGESGVVKVNAANFASGVYNYSLVVNGKILVTKRMSVVR